MYRHMIKLFLNYRANNVRFQCCKDITHKLTSPDKRYEDKAITSIAEFEEEPHVE